MKGKINPNQLEWNSKEAVEDEHKKILKKSMKQRVSSLKGSIKLTYLQD